MASTLAGKSRMLSLLKNNTCPIGVDLGNDSLKLVQLANGKQGVTLVAGKRIGRPDDIKPGSAQWQRWAAIVVREAIVRGSFRGKEVVASVPASDVFVETIRIPKSADRKVDDVVFAKIKQKLPFEADMAQTVIQSVPTGSDNMLVMASERRIIDRHLAIYEKAGLTLRSINAWPIAVTTCYGNFFARRNGDTEAVVMLLDIRPDCTNLVICQQTVPLSACSIPIGAERLGDEKVLGRLVIELTSCRRDFTATYKGVHVQRLIFMSGLAVDPEIYRTIAMQLEIQAQMGDCLAAVEISDPHQCGMDRRNGKASWATAFGLSLS